MQIETIFEMKTKVQIQRQNEIHLDFPLAGGYYIT